MCSSEAEVLYVREVFEKVAIELETEVQVAFELVDMPASYCVDRNVEGKGAPVNQPEADNDVTDQLRKALQQPHHTQHARQSLCYACSLDFRFFLKNSIIGMTGARERQSVPCKSSMRRKQPEIHNLTLLDEIYHVVRRYCTI